MARIDEIYLENLCTILESGVEKKDRTGTGTVSYPFVTIRHDMADGFPLLTLRRMPFKSALVELEGFIKGITSKAWYQEKGCHFWDEWASPDAIVQWEKENHPITSDAERKAVMKELNELGPVYGSQWNYFSGGLTDKACQLQMVRRLLKTEPTSRRMVVSAWNPDFIDNMALPPCHLLWQVNVTGNKLNLVYYQRSCDYILGHNLTGYGMLLTLLAKEYGYQLGVLGAVFMDCHVYRNHLNGVKVLLHRAIDRPAPRIRFKKWDGFDKWSAEDVVVENYNPGDKIEFPVSV